MHTLSCRWGTVSWNRESASVTTSSGRHVLILKALSGIKDIQLSTLPGHVLVYVDDLAKEPLMLGKVEPGMAILWSLQSVDVCDPSFFSVS